VVITVGFIGYLVAGFPGLSLLLQLRFCHATCLPLFLRRILESTAGHPSIKAFVDGITAAVIGALVGAVVVIAIRTITDIPAA
jgi:chromate transporter